MSKRTIIKSLVVLVPLLIGCSEPSIHKPSFKNYGKVTTNNEFTQNIKTYQEKAKLDFYDRFESWNANTIISKNTLFKCVISKVHKIAKPGGSAYLNIYDQLEETIQIDPEKQRFLHKYVEKHFMDKKNPTELGDVYKPTKYDINKYSDAETFYGELKGSNIIIASVKNKEIYKYGSEGLHDMAFLKSRFMSYVNALFFGEHILDNSLLYNSDSLFTYEYKTQPNLYSLEQTTTQLNYSKTLSYKCQSISSFKSDYIHEEQIRYVDLYIKQTSEDIKKVDYSNYTLSSSNIGGTVIPTMF